jgi:hypothetical protein
MGRPLEISARLMAAYWATVYDVLGSAETDGACVVSMSPGEAAPDLLPDLGRGWRRVAVVTACNPFSNRLADTENAARNRILERAVRLSGRRHLAAVGRDPVDEWPAEASLAVLDATDDELDDWMLQFGQNAVVVAERGGLVELREHPHEVERLRDDRWTSQRSACRVWRAAAQAQDAGLLAYALHPDVVHASQWSASPIRGRDAVLEHLARVFAVTCSEAGDLETAVRHELAAATVTDPARPCIATFQGVGVEPRWVTMLELDAGLVSQIDLCMPARFQPIVREA